MEIGGTSKSQKLLEAQGIGGNFWGYFSVLVTLDPRSKMFPGLKKSRPFENFRSFSTGFLRVVNPLV